MGVTACTGIGICVCVAERVVAGSRCFRFAAHIVFLATADIGTAAPCPKDTRGGATAISADA